MKHEIIYENNHVVFVAKYENGALVFTAKYWREVTLGL